MEKMKASELMKQMIANSQVAMIQEDKNMMRAVSDIVNVNNTVKWTDVLKVMNLNNEFMRIVYIKSIIKTLIDCGLVESDFNIDDVSVTNRILSDAVSEVCAEYNK